jgi:asparagine synthetase B (glutamine-hydrolysing)
MCSFLFARTTSQISDSTLTAANQYARHRGPDKTHVRRLTDSHGYHITMLHNLLDISGNTCTQPISAHGQSDLFALFNGEIYNFRDFGRFESDTECILPVRDKHGDETPSMLDGEFSIVVYDRSVDRLDIYTDPFLTKPLYLGRWGNETDFAVATCASSLRGIGCTRIEMAAPNASYKVLFSGLESTVETRENVVNFLLDQHKTDYGDWNAAFLTAVGKRALHGAHRPMVFLSSGYDSGAICLALNLQEIEYDTLSIMAGENQQVLEQRIRINRKRSCGHAVRIRGLSASDIQRMSHDIETHVEPFEYVHEDQPGVISTLQTDGGALGANYLAGVAGKQKRLVNLSGSGADEIMSDYGFAGERFYHHSEFGGRFPEDLQSIFPWKKFYGDTQRSYLFKDEYILGRHGIEGRYPFLDKQLVQEFLWLAPSLKNDAYKGAIEHFLSLYNYPFEPSKKRGFSPKLEPSALRRFFSRLLN